MNDTIRALAAEFGVQPYVLREFCGDTLALPPHDADDLPADAALVIREAWAVAVADPTGAE